MSENVENEAMSEPKAPNPSNSRTVGEILEKARLERGLSIDDIDQITHISPEWLTVIEQGAWVKYPSMVYAKGHVKVYAEFLGMNSEELDKQFQNEWVAKVKPDPNEVAALSNHPGINLTQTGSSRNYLVWGGVLIALSLIAILGIRYSMEEHRSSTMKKAVVTPTPHPVSPSPPVPLAPASPENSASGPGISPGSQGMPTTSVSSRSVEEGTTTGQGSNRNSVLSLQTPSNSNSLAIPRGGLTLKMVALKNTWVVISVDDGTVRRFHLRPGEGRSLTGKNFMTFSTEYGNGLVLFLNGKRLGLAGPTSDPVLHRRLNRLSLRPVHRTSSPDQLKKGIEGLGSGSLKTKTATPSPKGSATSTSQPLLPNNQQGAFPPSSQSPVESGSQSQPGRTP
ncbi:MAG: helix-turn-helix domain-containing protein [Nitrospiraceae bacterium]|nr:helix-turn-helix domain-containing protein [Nitrospiraceae bacterium]